MTLPGLTEGDIMSGQEEDQTQDKVDDMLETPQSKDTITIPIPFSQERIGKLIIPAGMTADDWKRLYRILAAYKPETEENSHSGQDTGTTGSNSQPTQL